MLTLKERILIYLDDHLSDTLGIPAKKLPVSLSSLEIISALDITDKVFSKPINTLVKEGAVEKKRFYVRETGRFRNFYFLTEAGTLKAKELKEELGNKKIKVSERGAVKEIAISEFVKHLAKLAELKKKPVEINYTNVLKNISPTGFLDPKVLLEPRKLMDLSDRLPVIRYFVGREKEFEELRKFIKSNSRVLCIKGIAGIGKTTLVAHWVKELGMNIFWYRIHELSSVRSMLMKFSDFLSSLGKRKLRNYLKEAKIVTDEVFMMLENELKDSNCLLVLDDFQKANEDLVAFFYSLKDLKTDLKMIVLGRAIPLFYDRRDVIVRKIVSETVLEGLDRDSSMKLLRYRGIKEEAERLYSLTKGHPLLLELVMPGTTAEAKEFFEEEVVKRLNNKEIKCLGLASVFRYPFYHRAVCVDDIDYSTIVGLVERSLMQRSGEVFDLHDIIKEFFYNRLTQSEKLKNHVIAGEYYELEEGEASALEATYHFLKGNDYRKALKLAIGNGERVIHKGFGKEFMSLLAEFDEKNIEKSDWCKLLMLNGECHYILGAWDNAMKAYNHSLKLSEELDDYHKIADCYLKIGSVYDAKSDWNPTLENFKKGLEISEKINYFKGVADGNYGVGYVYWRFGKLDHAIRYMTKSLNTSKQIKDRHREARAYTLLGNVYLDKGNYKDAIELFNKSLAIFEKLSNNCEIVRMYNNLGTCYGRMRDFHTAIDYSEKQVKLADEIGFARAVAYGLCNLAWEYTELGKLDKAMEYCEKSLSLSKKLGEKNLIGQSHETYGCIFHRKREWGKAKTHFNESISIHKEIGDLRGLSEVYFDYGRMYKEKGKLKKARELFEKSLNGYKKLRNKEKIKELEKELKEIGKHLLCSTSLPR